MYKYFRFFTFLSFTLVSGTAAAQGLGNSPYSRIGLGDIIGNTGSIRNLGMGGTGVSTANGFQLNSINPALLYYNNFTVLDFSVASQVKRISDSENDQVDGNASLSSLALSFPLAKNWSACLGLKPYSIVQYKTTTLDVVQGYPDATPDTTVQKIYEGSGGISEIYFSHGFKIAKGLTVGASASYLFGSIVNESSIRANVHQVQAQRVVFNDRTRYNDFIFKGGAAYRKELKENRYVAIGGVYTLGGDLDAERRLLAQRLGPTDNLIDEVVFSDSVAAQAKLPHALQLGISYDNGKNWSIALDYTGQQVF